MSCFPSYVYFYEDLIWGKFDFNLGSDPGFTCSVWLTIVATQISCNDKSIQSKKIQSKIYFPALCHPTRRLYHFILDVTIIDKPMNIETEMFLGLKCILAHVISQSDSKVSPDFDV